LLPRFQRLFAPSELVLVSSDPFNVGVDLLFLFLDVDFASLDAAKLARSSAWNDATRL